MKDIILFLKDYWQLILAAIVFILSFILQLIKKKPINDFLTDVYNASILAINDTEVYSMADPNVKGEEKLSLAIQYVVKFLRYKYPDLNFSASRIEAIRKVIEGILSTPQKKGGNVDGQ